MKLNQEIYEKLRNYPYLSKICLERQHNKQNCLNYNLKLEFYDIDSYTEDSISILFYGVQNFKAKNLDGLLCPYIVIEDISKSQLENIKYYVKESEEDMFSFYCSLIEIE